MTKETKGCQQINRGYSNLNRQEIPCNPYYQDLPRTCDNGFNRINEDQCRQTNDNNSCNNFFSNMRDDCCSDDFTSNRCNSRPSNNNNGCCCKRAMKRSLDILLNPSVRNLIDLTSFTLIGQNFTTDTGATTIKSISSCGDSLITFSDATGNLSITTLCDLAAISFSLVPFTSTPANSEEELMAMFTVLIRKFLPKVNPKKFCCTPEDECCCNHSKASFLANSIGTVNVQVNSSTLDPNPVLNSSLITVTDEIAWFFDENNNVLIVCLDDIVALG